MLLFFQHNRRSANSCIYTYEFKNVTVVVSTDSIAYASIANEN